MAVAWLAIFLLWGSWLLGALFYVQTIFTDLDAVYNWHEVMTGEAIRTASAGLGISPSAFAWMTFGMELALVTTYGVAGVILFRHKRDWFGAFLGVSLVLIATRIGGPVTFILYSKWPVLEQPFEFLSGMAFVAFGALLYIFPDGRFVPSWSRWLLLLMLLPMVWESAGMPLAPELLTVLSLIYLGIGLGAQVYRYRRLSDAVARRHVRWIIASFAAFVLIIFAGVLIAPNAVAPTRPPAPRDLLATLIISLAITVASISFVVALSVAVLRDGLYNLDILVNRALVYGGLTVLITATYVLFVGGAGLLFHSQNSLLISLLATGLIAVLFQPIRNRLQSGANRLLYGDRDNPYKVLSQLGRQLQETAVPGETLPVITATICRTLKLPYAAVALETADGERRTVASTGQSATIVEEWPLLHQGERVGWLIVAPRSPQEPFTNRERQLLADIAGQAGAAAYAERLTSALQRSRERLVLAREEERRRIRRDLHDELGPSLASQTFALDTALELLEADPLAAATLLESLKSQNQALIADIRRLVYALRPPSLDELGLLAALRIHVSQLVPDNNGLRVKVTAVPEPLPPLPAAVEVAAYRIALEGITNVVRHAQAHHADIRLTVAQDSLRIVIADDGRGLPAELRPGVGLASMRERAEELGGEFAVESAEGGGVLVVATLPLTKINQTSAGGKEPAAGNDVTADAEAR